MDKSRKRKKFWFLLEALYYGTMFLFHVVAAPLKVNCHKSFPLVSKAWIYRLEFFQTKKNQNVSQLKILEKVRHFSPNDKDKEDDEEEEKDKDKK